MTIPVILIGIAISMIHYSVSEAKPEDDANASYRYYKEVCIERGDSLWSIASEAYPDASDADMQELVEEIRSINGLPGYSILEGEYLIVPYEESVLH